MGAAGDTTPIRGRESATARAARYRAAIRFIARQHDAEELWPIARTALSYVDDGMTIENAWREACEAQGFTP